MNPAWTQMLARVERSLAEAHAEADRHEQLLVAPELAGDDGGERTAAWHRALERLGDRLKSWQTHTAEADRRAAAVDAELTARSAELGRWLEKLRTLQAAVAERADAG
jgi:hypothetical protein